MHDRAPRKKAVNLTVDAKLLEEARAAGLNLSGALERALEAELSVRRAAKWREDNKEAIEESRRELERNGLWYTPDWLQQ